MIKNFFSFSKLSVLIILIGWFYHMNNIKPWNGNGTIVSDVISYYSYLPATFIYDDPHFNFIDTVSDEYVKSKIWVLTSPEGFRHPKMSLGLSLMYSPFFGIAHFIAKNSSYPANGYSLPYEILICLSAFFYAFLGILLLRKILLNYFSEKITALSLLVLAFGTNLFFYVTVWGPMSHAYNFFILILLLYATIKWHEKPRFIYSIIIGVCIGLATVVRPTNLLFALIPILYNVYNYKTLLIKLRIVRRNIVHVLVIALVFIIPLIPQLVYWKVVTGSFIYWSYTDEGFHFLNPKLLPGFFGFRKGWLIYTPIMIFSLIGLYWLRRVREYAFLIPAYLSISIYVILSWWCWWYGGSFGMRTFVDFYGLLAIPLCLCFEKIFEIKRQYIVKFISAISILFFISLNIFQTWQYRITLIHWDSMNYELYKAVFLKKHFPENYDELKTPPDYEKAMIDEEEDYR